MRAMRKLTVFLLISLLMLQAALAAAGSACLHERDGHAQHFGHHAHQHRATLPDDSASADTAHAADAANTADTGDLDQDHDCTTCHANALTGVPARLDWPPLPEGAAVVADDVPLHLSPPPPARPERPNWRTAA